MPFVLLTQIYSHLRRQQLAVGNWVLKLCCLSGLILFSVGVAFGQEGVIPQNGANAGSGEESQEQEETQAETTPDEIAGDETSGDETNDDGSTDGENPDEVPDSDTLNDDEDGTLLFTFGGAAWREVIEWVAGEADLALHVSEMPTGSFTYSDPTPYTPDQAIARINLFLLPQGFTLVRSRKLLSVINLADPRGLEQLDSLAANVTADQLSSLNTYDVVKCIFALEDLNAEEAVEELSALNLMSTPLVFNRTNRIMITDTVGKLQTVKAILDAFEPNTLANGTVVRNFPLEHVDAEEILIVARPHLGLATGESIGIDVSVSSDPQGKNLFVTGVEDKVLLIENLIKSLDVEDTSLSVTNGDAELKSHPVPGGNVETVYNVLITLLAGKTVRLSMDETAGTIVALATPEIQEEIAQTVAALQASEEEFKVIPLKHIDPYLVVSLLEEMLDIPDPIFDDPEDEGYNHDAPKIDADPDLKRLFVRGKPRQIERIEEIIEELDVSETASDGDDEIRLIPISMSMANQVVETAAKFWRRDNLIILLPKLTPSDGNTERVIAEQDSSLDGSEFDTERSQEEQQSTGRVLAGDITSTVASIQCQPTPRGLLLQSEDIEALNELVSSIQTISGNADTTPSPPIVYYLKYTKPDAAIRMLAELLDGGDAVSDADSGSLVNGIVSSGGLFLSSLVSTAQGTTTMTAGTITVVADTRLNRLIAQGTEADIERIESYLKIIDKDSSITAVETYGRAHIIELKYANASDVAATLREAYGSRVSGGRSGGQQQQSQDPRQRDRRQEQPERGEDEQRDQRDNQENRGRDQQNGGEQRGRDGRQPGGQPNVNIEPTMTIAVHQPSNSLIITAPDGLFQEVENLVKLIDTRDRRVTEIIPIDDKAVIGTLRTMFGDPSSEGGSTLQVPRDFNQGRDDSRSFNGAPSRFQGQRGDPRRGDR